MESGKRPPRGLRGRGGKHVEKPLQRAIHRLVEAGFGPDSCLPGGRVADLHVKKLAVGGHPTEKLAPKEEADLDPGGLHVDLAVHSRVRFNKPAKQRPGDLVADLGRQPFPPVANRRFAQFPDAS